MQVSLFIFGDPTYLLMSLVMKGFSGPNVAEEKQTFIEQLCKMRVQVEHAVGRLKTRWRVLTKRSDIHHTSNPTAELRCILHNLCEKARNMLPLPVKPESLGFPWQPPQHACQDQPNHTAPTVRRALVQQGFSKVLPERAIVFLGYVF